MTKMDIRLALIKHPNPSKIIIDNFSDIYKWNVAESDYWNIIVFLEDVRQNNLWDRLEKIIGGIESMKYKVGDKVRIKSIDWYNENKDEYGYIDCGSRAFLTKMSDWCGKIATIKEICKTNCYRLEEYDFDWTDEMIEGLVKPKFKVGDILFYRGETSGYLKVEEIREENGEIRYYETSRNLYLIENDPNVFADKVCSVETEETKPIDFTVRATNTKGKVEVVIPDGYGYEIENDKLYFITKKKEYPKTYKECCEVLFEDASYAELTFVPAKISSVNLSYIKGDFVTDLPSKVIPYKEKLNALYKLLICRNAYWKIAGEEMGLGKPWEPDYTEESYEQGCPLKYVIYYTGTHITKERKCTPSYVLSFPTEEMRYQFYENFKELIEQCKELL